MTFRATRIISIFFTALFTSLGAVILFSILKAPAILVIFLASFISLLIWQAYCKSLKEMWTRTFFILGAESILAPVVLFLSVAARVNSTTAGTKLGTLFAGTVVVGMAAIVGIALGIAFITAGFILLKRTSQHK